MPLILPELLTIPPQDLYSISIPFAADGFGRLQLILYMARWQLRTYHRDTLEQACEDILVLYDWFFNRQEKQLHTTLKQELTTANPVFVKYFDRTQYITECMDAIKRLYPGHVDILQSILTECDDIQMLSDIKEVNANMANTEFFCVLALYKGGLALTELHQYQLSAYQRTYTTA